MVFVPREALEGVRDAVFAAGAGRIGDYERCSWYTEGTRDVPRWRGTSPAMARRVARSGSRSCGSRPSSRPSVRTRCRGAGERTPVRGARIRDLRALVKARLFTDGGARGNPGPAAYGYVLEAEDGTVLDSHGEAIGVATNNVPSTGRSSPAWSARRSSQVGELEVVSDSELLVKQMRGEYRVKNDALQELSHKAGGSRGFGSVALHGRAPRAERARRQARQRGAGRRRARLECRLPRGCSSVG